MKADNIAIQVPRALVPKIDLMRARLEIWLGEPATRGHALEWAVALWLAEDDKRLARLKEKDDG